MILPDKNNHSLTKLNAMQIYKTEQTQPNGEPPMPDLLQQYADKASIVLEIKAVFSNLETKLIELLTEKRA
jgi:hypothetical protein